MRTKGQIKEQKDAKSFNAKGTPRSGGLWFAKGDSKNETFLIDSKKTDHERYSITADVWEKINREALLTNKLPLLSIEFGKKKIELVILDKNDFINLMDSKVKKTKG